LLPLIGRFDEAREAYAADVERAAERGDRIGLAIANDWIISMESGQFEAAERAARHSCELLEEMGERFLVVDEGL
jgi:uncharacterized protein (DUF58 family)